MSIACAVCVLDMTENNSPPHTFIVFVPAPCQAPISVPLRKYRNKVNFTEVTSPFSTRILIFHTLQQCQQ